ncbi:MAG TPA: ThuA domain-containing protein [Anaerolineae bacterium]|nr:ThuA domain-containing protein [Anaerolineae bacterium]
MSADVLLISSGLAHPSLLAQFYVRRALTLPGYHLTRAASLEQLPALDPGRYDAVVLYIHHDHLSPSALGCLQDVVGGGAGLLAIHAASASFKGNDAYYDIIGGRFVEHGPITGFRVEPARGKGDRLFGTIPPFTVRDELYRHQYDPANRVHLVTLVDGQPEPVVWTRRYPDRGGGRVCYLSLGHTLSSVRHPQVQAILQRGLAWVCGATPR